MVREKNELEEIKKREMQVKENEEVRSYSLTAVSYITEMYHNENALCETGTENAR